MAHTPTLYCIAAVHYHIRSMWKPWTQYPCDNTKRQGPSHRATQKRQVVGLHCTPRQRGALTKWKVSEHNPLHAYCSCPCKPRRRSSPRGAAEPRHSAMDCGHFAVLVLTIFIASSVEIWCLGSEGRLDKNLCKNVPHAVLIRTAAHASLQGRTKKRWCRCF